jgi:hypothetical protein
LHVFAPRHEYTWHACTELFATQADYTAPLKSGNSPEGSVA